MLKNEVFDYKFNRLGLLEEFDYCQYTESLYESGTFNLRCPATPYNISLVKENRIIWFEEDVAGIIQYTDIEEEKGKATIEVKGSLLDAILDWRYIYPALNKTGRPQEIMEEAVLKNCINSTSPERNFEMLEIERNQDDYEIVSKQKTGGSVCEFLTEFSPAYEMGFKIGFYPKIKKFIFKVIKGVDRSISNKEGNSKVIFSESLNNMISMSFVQDIQDYRNITLVAGEATDVGRTTRLVDDGSEYESSFFRRELYTDARDIQSEYSDDDGEQHTYSDSEYQKLLNTRGLEKLAECVPKKSLQCETRTDADTAFIYRKHYNLGDKVTAIRETYDFVEDVIITEVIITQDKNTYSVEPVLGNGIPTLYSKLKKEGVII